jgi:hypothetical protein
VPAARRRCRSFDRRYWRTPTKSAETSIRTRRSSRASIFPSRASLGTRRKNSACASRRSPAGPIGCRAKPNGNMPAARARWDPFISGPPSPPSWRTIVEPAARYAAKATAKASPLTSITTRNMNRAAMVRAPLGFFEAKRRPPGTFPPNRYGLYDMHGNVWEYCQDKWSANYADVPVDGSANLSGPSDRQRVLRGGSWSHNPAICRSAYRDSIALRLLGLAGPHRPQGGLYSLGKR